MSEILFGYAVQMSHQSIEFGSYLHTLCPFGNPIFMALETNLVGQIVELRAGADQLCRACHDGLEHRVAIRNARDRQLVDIKHVHVGKNLLADKPIAKKASHNRSAS